MEVLRGEAEAVVGHINAQDNQGTCMQVGINDDDLQAHIHVEYELKEEPPKDYSDGQFHTEGDFVNYLDIVLQTRL